MHLLSCYQLYQQKMNVYNVYILPIMTLKHTLTNAQSSTLICGHHHQYLKVPEPQMDQSHFIPILIVSFIQITLIFIKSSQYY